MYVLLLFQNDSNLLTKIKYFNQQQTLLFVFNPSGETEKLSNILARELLLKLLPKTNRQTI